MSAASSAGVGRWFAVVPAAGRSVRMGRPKLLLPWTDADGSQQTILGRVLATWRSMGPAAVVLVAHPDDADVAAVGREAGAEVVRPAVPPPDMKASIVAALEHLELHHHPAPADVWLTAPADLPQLSASVIERLLQSYDRNLPQIIRPVHAGRFGHPSLLPWSTAAEVGTIPTNRGLDYLFERLPFRSIESGAACLAADVDTPDDYRRLHDR